LVETIVASGTSSTFTTIDAISVNASCEPSGHYIYYLTLIPRSGFYDATGWVSTSGVNGATPGLISDFGASGPLQYSAADGSPIE
jgi:hypothetical protein